MTVCAACDQPIDGIPLCIARGWRTVAWLHLQCGSSRAGDRTRGRLGGFDGQPANYRQDTPGRACVSESRVLLSPALGASLTAAVGAPAVGRGVTP